MNIKKEISTSASCEGNTSQLKKIVFLYTDLQKNIFNSIHTDEKSEFIYIYPIKRHELAELNYISIQSSDQNLDIKKSRSLIKEIKKIIKLEVGKSEFELWLASCDNPIGQVLINHKQCKKVALIEDGIGSYVRHPFMELGKGYRNILRKVKYIALLFPHYRSYYGIGSQNADEYWALHQSAFPRASKRPNIISTDNLKKAFSKKNSDTKISNKTALYLDQPLTRNKIVEEEDLEALIKIHIEELEKDYAIEVYLIKPHPVSTPEETLKTIESFKKYTKAKVLTLEDKSSVESISLSPDFNPITVFSFISSALYTIKSLRPDLNISSITTENAVNKNPILSEYISAMNSIGIKTKTYR